MFSLATNFITKAEIAASEGASRSEVLAMLRKLSLSDFGLFLISLPNSGFPALSAMLPRMAPAGVQDSWTGQNGFNLYKTTLPFALQLQDISTRFGKHREGLYGKTVLDFGCGYGRFIRMMYYFTEPQNIWGVDPWEASLQTCHDAGLDANFVQSEDTPTTLPVGETKFDFGFSFSVFTHLAPDTAKACLSAVRASMVDGGIFVPTIRPIEFWEYYAKNRDHVDAARMEKHHIEEGIAYTPSQGQRGKTFGDTSMKVSWLDGSGWRVLGYDSNIYEPYQISVVLQAV